MERDYINQHLLVDRYIQGSLEGSELDEFEERLAWDSALVDEVQLAEHLRAALREATAAGAAGSSGTGIAGAVREFFAVPGFAAAASFLLAVGLTVGVQMTPLMRPGDRPDGSALQTDIIPLFATRSGNEATVEVDPEAWTVLLVDVAAPYPAYRITVRNDDPAAAPVWHQDRLLPTYPDSLAVGLPGSMLPPGRYVLTIEGSVTTDSGEIAYERIQDIPFLSTPAE